MMIERTLGIIKPDATARNLTGAIIQRIEDEGFRVVGMRQMLLSQNQAEGFYAEHRERPFFNDLVSFMTSGPVVLLAMEREDAITHWRSTMGATNPSDAPSGSIRNQYGESIERNSVHGSDSPTSATREVGYFFSCFDLV
ncbi:MAG: nucleoside-diphosphate kinase [Myxococcales bacterium]|nr:nucleoside-diphosphate kinase [Myxococcales bacterium]|tara:strand:+ start:3197 stop:3616 length:420 start_codon:yes stop_codon:yes gene_type:complete